MLQLFHSRSFFSLQQYADFQLLRSRIWLSRLLVRSWRRLQEQSRCWPARSLATDSIVVLCRASLKQLSNACTGTWAVAVMAGWHEDLVKNAIHPHALNGLHCSYKSDSRASAWCQRGGAQKLWMLLATVTRKQLFRCCLLPGQICSLFLPFIVIGLWRCMHFGCSGTGRRTQHKQEKANHKKHVQDFLA